MPHTDSLVSDKDIPGSQSRRVDREGKRNLAGALHRHLALASYRTVPCTKKLRSLLRHRKSHERSCRGPEQHCPRYAPFARMGNAAAKRPLEEIHDPWPENPCLVSAWDTSSMVIEGIDWHPQGQAGPLAVRTLQSARLQEQLEAGRVGASATVPGSGPW